MENYIPGTMMLLTVKDPDEFLNEVKSLGGYKQAIDAWLSEMNKQFEPYNFEVKYQQFAENLHISSIDYDKHSIRFSDKSGEKKLSETISTSRVVDRPENINNYLAANITEIVSRNSLTYARKKGISHENIRVSNIR